MSDTVADLNRLLNRSVETGDRQRRIDDIRDVERYVLLGEPGSGKSTAFDREARAAGTAKVTARAFRAGARPAGHVVFIDALEEYRIGETGVDRLFELAAALRDAGYAHWRIACRSISLPPGDARLLVQEAGLFETWQLERLDRWEILAILESLGEPDPQDFVDRVETLAAVSLLENPATLKMLRRALAGATAPITHRGALFDEATRQMAHELNPDMPESTHRPPAAHIVAAAERACILLLLSGRSDIWSLSTLPPDADTAVTRDDLILAGVDTDALRIALGTALFRGEAGAFLPSHRVVAEYLGARALADATAPTDGRPALSLERALAFMCGDDDRPAPALTGLFAWFVTVLANSVHSDRALTLVEANPEALLFHGDPAMLPTLHRRALLRLAGRDDPWFLSAARGSTALGGLAGDDIAPELLAILVDEGESLHRRAMVLEALAAGRRVVALQSATRTFALDSAKPLWLRRRALLVAVTHAETPLDERRELFDLLRGETGEDGLILQLELLPDMVGWGATVADVKANIERYAASAYGVMGYLRPLGEALARSPMPDLFDQGIVAPKGQGPSRWFETRGVINRALAATIVAVPSLSADRLQRWLHGAQHVEMESLDSAVQNAAREWMEAQLDGPSAFFWAMVAATRDELIWAVDHEFHNLTGIAVPTDVRDEVVARLEQCPPGPAFNRLAAAAFRLTGGQREGDDRYWRTWEALRGHAETQELFDALSFSAIDDWRAKQAVYTREQDASRIERIAKDRSWLIAHAGDLRSGTQLNALCYAAEVYFGYRDLTDLADPLDRLTAWAGTTAPDILAGWDVVAMTSADTFAAMGREEGAQRHPRRLYLIAAWADHRLASAPTLSLPLAFDMLRASFVLTDAAKRDSIRAAATDHITRDRDGPQALVDFWSAAARAGAQNLPFAFDFGDDNAAAATAIELFLQRWPVLREPVLRDAISTAAKLLPATKLALLADRALASLMPLHAQRLWTFAAFMLAPDTHSAAMACELGDYQGRQLFESMGQCSLIGSFRTDAETKIRRSALILKTFGPDRRPDEHRIDQPDRLSDSLTAGISAIAASPTALAADTLKVLIDDPSLSAWHILLQHHAAQQAPLLRAARFKAPLPAAVARALTAGPPATPADMRAVVREVIGELAHDIRHGDTSPWKGFWNCPYLQPRTPKIENDCRDLLTDRLRDRLLRFGIPVKASSTEARSENDRRADLLILGKGDAVLPIEAKRHWNSELWTAPEDQLIPYAQSAGSSGHGIYLIFWFGLAGRALPTPPGGARPIQSAAELQAALVASLSPELKDKIDVIVLDVSEAADAPLPATGRKSRPRKAAS